MTADKFRSRLGRWFTVPEIKQAYVLTDANAMALQDLAEFCHANDPAPRDSDLFLQGRAAGRRDVFLHIAEHLQLTEDELTAVYRGRSLPTRSA